jgi:hypothetical protein
LRHACKSGAWLVKKSQKYTNSLDFSAAIVTKEKPGDGRPRAQKA